MKIRPAVAQDTKAIGLLAEATDLFPADMLDDMIAGYLKGGAADLWLVADDGDVRGFAFCEPERMADGAWNLLAIAVSPQRQGAGVGAALVRHIEAALAQAKARILIVETLGTEEFRPTRDFYLKNGFAEEAVIRDFYEDGGDKVVLWKRVAP